jgi:hypothetical protein
MKQSAVFNLIWTYVVKELDDRKKARCTCDGSTRGGQVRVLDHTFANSIDQTGSRIFYAVAAAENLLVFGADVSNAFGEAPPPKQGFYIRPDTAFREWYKAHYNSDIPDGWVIPVLAAMQGHPESPRLWEKHCNRILKKIGLVPTIHEPCLYLGVIDNEKAYFKRQVDDLAIACNLRIQGRPKEDPHNVCGYMDASWGDCLLTRRSTGGVCFRLAGGPVAWKGQLLPTVALSSTEAEFMEATVAGRMSLYIRSIMWDLGIPQEAATILYEDNDGATAMVNAGKPTSRSRHIDIKFYAIQEWVERDLIILQKIDTALNMADHYTKPLPQILFYRHNDYNMGWVPPTYYLRSTWSAYACIQCLIRERQQNQRNTLLVPQKHWHLGKSLY